MRQKRAPKFSRRRQRCVAAVPISAAGFVGSSLAPPIGVRTRFPHRPGGLRYAATSGYPLLTLRVARLTDSPSHRRTGAPTHRRTTNLDEVSGRLHRNFGPSALTKTEIPADGFSNDCLSRSGNASWIRTSRQLGKWILFIRFCRPNKRRINRPLSLYQGSNSSGSVAWYFSLTAVYQRLASDTVKQKLLYQIRQKRNPLSLTRVS